MRVLLRTATRSVVSMASVSWLLALAAPARAHQGAHEEIDDVSRRMEAEVDPVRRSALYLRRGELYRLHGDLGAAVADYRRARALDASLDVVDLCLAQAMLQFGYPVRAKIAADRFLAKRPDHVQALVARARALAKSGEPLLAATDYSRAIDGCREPERPLPEYYLERARALAAAGTEHLDEAIEGLDEGLRRLGPVVTLQLRAIELEVERGCTEGALERIERAAAQSPRSEGWLARRGEVLEGAGRTTEACQAYAEALSAVALVPQHRRRTRAVTDLEERLQAAVERLDGVTTSMEESHE